MPFLSTFPTTDGSCMLSNENRMPSHRSLFAVIFGKSGRNPGIYKLICVIFNGFETFGGNITGLSGLT
jgi:hypothetical protein